jgi:peptidoglycan/LPS O-acetylase OafA/YrhL
LRTTVTPEGRLQSLELLRVGAMLTVVVSHATVSYMSLPTPELLWVVRDRSPSGVFDAFFWVSGVVLSVFFLVAGFSAAALYDRRGPSDFLRDRGRRLLAPFLIAGSVILPLTFYVWAAGWWLDGRCTLNEIRRVRFAAEIQSQLFGPVHLWFLEYLIIYSGVYWLVRAGGEWWTTRFATPARVDIAWPARWFVAASVLVLLIDVGAVANLHNSFVPAPMRLLYHGLFFAAGATWLRRPGAIDRLASFGRVATFLWVPVFVVVAVLFRLYLMRPLGGMERMLLSLSIALFVWVSVVGAFGLAQVAGQRGLRIELLMAASYWVYLVHLPLVGALQLALARVDASPFLKVPAVVAVTLAVAVWSYRRLVQGSAWGAWFGFTRVLPMQVIEPQSSAAAAIASTISAGGN